MDTMVAFDEHFTDSEDGRLELVSLTHEAMAMADRFPETGTVTYGQSRTRPRHLSSLEP